MAIPPQGCLQVLARAAHGEKRTKGRRVAARTFNVPFTTSSETRCRLTKTGRDPTNPNDTESLGSRPWRRPANDCRTLMSFRSVAGEGCLR